METPLLSHILVMSRVLARGHDWKHEWTNMKGHRPSKHAWAGSTLALASCQVGTMQHLTLKVGPVAQLHPAIRSHLACPFLQPRGRILGVGSRGMSPLETKLCCSCVSSDVWCPWHAWLDRESDRESDWSQTVTCHSCPCGGWHRVHQALLPPPEPQNVTWEYNWLCCPATVTTLWRASCCTEGKKSQDWLK